MTKAIDKQKQWDRLNLGVYATKEPVPVINAPQGLILTNHGIFYKSSGTASVSTWRIDAGQKGLSLLAAMQEEAKTPDERRAIALHYATTLVWPLVINDREPDAGSREEAS